MFSSPSSSSEEDERGPKPLRAMIRGESQGVETDVEDPRRAESERRSYWKSSLFLELLGCFGLAVLCVIPIFYLYFGAEPYQRPIPFQLLESGEYVRNMYYDHAKATETISNALGAILGGVLPFLVQIILAWCRHRKLDRQGPIDNDVHASLCMYMVAFVFVMLVSEATKAFVGYLRPSFYEACQPNEDFSACTTSDGSDDARNSFPSGHSAASFCGYTLMVSYIHDRFGMGPRYNRDKLPPKSLLRRRAVSLLSFTLMAPAIYFAVNRIRVNKHHPSDVVAGSLLGSSVAIFIHGLWIY